MESRGQRAKALRLELLSEWAEVFERGPPLFFLWMPEKIYRLSLEWKPVENIPGRFFLEVRLDDTFLLDLVREWELEHVPEAQAEAEAQIAALRQRATELHWREWAESGGDCAAAGTLLEVLAWNTELSREELYAELDTHTYGAFSAVRQKRET